MSADVDAADDAKGDGWDATRRRVLERDDYECRFCGMSDDEHREEHGRGLSAHHIIPDADGGEDTPANLITVCQSCHRTLESTHAKAVAQLQKDPRAVEKIDVEISSTYDAMNDIDRELLRFIRSHPTFSREMDVWDADNELHGDPPFAGGWSPRGNSDVSTEWEFAATYGYREGVLDAMNRMESELVRIRAQLSPGLEDDTDD